MLVDGVTRDAIDDCLIACDLRLVNLVPEGAAPPRQLIASSPDGATVATFVEDGRLGISYVVVEGSRPHLDHVRFRERLRKLIPQLNDIKEWEEPRFNQVCDELRSLIADIDRHNEQEVELLQESMLVDDGGEG